MFLLCLFTQSTCGIHSFYYTTDDLQNIIFLSHDLSSIPFFSYKVKYLIYTYMVYWEEIFLHFFIVLLTWVNILDVL